MSNGKIEENSTMCLGCTIYTSTSNLEAAFKILFHCGKPSEQQDALVGFILKQPRYFYTLGGFLATLYQVSISNP